MDIWTVDTKVDTSMRDAEIRTAPLFTPALGAEIESLPAVTAPGATWLTWTQHQATTSATATVQAQSGAPPNTPTVAYRSYAITVQPHGRDGWMGPAVIDVEFLTLARTSGGQWLVSKFGPQ